MKFLIVFVALFAFALAAPSGEVDIVRQDSDVEPEGFKFGVELTDGTKHDAAGKLNHIDSEHAELEVHGSFSWVDEKTGQKFTVDYVADKNGFQPKGAHLPVA